jgi:hypothetical protein
MLSNCAGLSWGAELQPELSWGAELQPELSWGVEMQPGTLS